MTKKKSTAAPIPEELNQVETAETKSPEEPKAKSKEPKANAKVHPFRKLANEIFASHPKCEKLFFTADGTGFFEEQHARIHAGTLKTDTVELIKREEA